MTGKGRGRDGSGRGGTQKCGPQWGVEGVSPVEIPPNIFDDNFSVPSSKADRRARRTTGALELEAVAGTSSTAQRAQGWRL